MMSTDTSLHADQARWHVGKPCLHLVARPLLTQHKCAAIVQADNVERVLTDIDADYGYRCLCCRRPGVLLVLAPLASLSMAGQEHGRTIPLAEIIRTEAIGSSWLQIVPIGIWHSDVSAALSPPAVLLLPGSMRFSAAQNQT
jgi:hypothetical protein